MNYEINTINKYIIKLFERLQNVISYEHRNSNNYNKSTKVATLLFRTPQKLISKSITVRHLLREGVRCEDMAIGNSFLCQISQPPKSTEYKKHLP